VPASNLQSILGHLRRRHAPAADAELLARFASRRDADAFAALVGRHGPLVLGVCRRILGDAHAAEDAFQATFLALARQAGALRRPTALPAWLHGVAVRTARHAQTRQRRAHGAETHRAPPCPPPDPLAAVSGRELLVVIDDELSRLPEAYRLPLVLCGLQGLARDEAAARLGWSLGALRGRLERGRELLRRRLEARGLTVPAVFLGVLTTGAAVPPEVLAATRRAALAALAAPAAWGAANVLTAAATVLLALGIAAGVAVLPGGQPGPPLGERRPPAAASAEPAARVDHEGVPLPPGALARMGSGRLRHTGRLRNLAFTPDGKSLVVGGDYALRLWDVAAGRLRRRFDLPSDWSLRMAFAADGTVLTVVEGYRFLTCRRLSVVTGQELTRVELSGADDAFPSPQGDRLAVVSHDEKTIRLCDPATGREAFRLGYRGGEVGLAFAPRGAALALADGGDAIRIHETAHGRLLAELKRDGAVFRRVAISPDGRFLAAVAGAKQNQVSIWDLATGQERHRLPEARRAELLASFSADGRLLATSPPEGPVGVWDVATGREVRRWPVWPGIVRRLEFAPQGPTLAASTSGGTVLLWDAATGQPRPASADPGLAVSELRFAGDGGRLVGSAEGWVAWDSAAGRVVRRFPNVPDPDGPTRLAPDETLIAVAEPAGTIRLDDAAAGRTLRRLEGSTGRVWVMQFAPDGRRLFAAGADRAVCVWDVATGRRLHRLGGHSDPIGRFAVSPDGRWLASATDSPNFQDFAVRVWDVGAGRVVRQLTPRRGSAHALAFSPDGRLLAAVGGQPGVPNDRGEVQVWDWAAGRERGAFAGHAERVTCAAFSPDGRALATGSIDRTVRLWELASGQERHRFLGHEGAISSVAFAPDGRRLAAASPEAPVYVWDVLGLTNQLLPPPTAAELEHAWAALAGDDAKTALQAIRRLAAAPGPAVAFLGERLTPAAVDAGHVRELIRRLDSPRFAERRLAARELERLADRATPILRTALKDAASAEVRQALHRLLDHVEAGTPETLRALRAVEALEHTASPAARQHLRALAGGAPGARLTDEAAAALRRLEKTP
jgi:RNA polymerase sigma factor (sigma-70 family)